MLMYVTAIALVIFVLLFVIEKIVPLRSQKHSLWQRLFVNFCVTAAAVVVNGMLVQPSAQATMHWAGQNSIGLVHLIELPPAIASAIAFLLMDLTFYYWHRANHEFPLLWRFHNAHHIDPDLDVSTGFRFHFVEIAFSAGFRVLQVAVIGVSLEIYLLYELVFLTNTLFHHSNIWLPIELERWLNIVLVTPRMHGIHHSQVQEETNSNYSVVFPWWDRLHQTLRLNVPQLAIDIGIPAYSSAEDNKLRQIFIMPFQKQRHYWYKSDDKLIARNPAILGEDKTQMVDAKANTHESSLTPKTE